jgi:hypothetical protein
MERSRLAVSPFDGANRIRFKGSLEHCLFAIADCRLLLVGVSFKLMLETNRKLAIGNRQCARLSAARLQKGAAPPKRYLIFNP